MIFELNNIGILNQASLNIKGLTILAGCNDIGKSFIGRIIYSVIKTINQSNDQINSAQHEPIEELLDKIYHFLRVQQIEYSKSVRDFFFPPDVFSNIVKFTGLSRKNELIEYVTSLKKSIYLSIPKESQFNKYSQFFEFIDSSFEQLIQISLEDQDKEKMYLRFFNGLIKNEFQDQICNNSNSASILCSDNQSTFLQIQLEENNAYRFDLKDSMYFEDVTLIETPFILQLSNFILASLAFNRSPILNRVRIKNRTDIPSHIIDLIQKIQVPDNNYFFETENEINTLRQTIGDIIEGSVYFNEKQRMILFKKNDGTEIKPVNIATGVKTFGLIQLLINSNAINPRSILIIDEPEVHLHPLWQYEYSKIIIQLVKIGVHIIISSHSPYMIKALSTLSKSSNLQDITNFYFGEKGKNQRVEFTDVTNNMEPVYQKLAEPMQRISFESIK